MNVRNREGSTEGLTQERKDAQPGTGTDLSTIRVDRPRSTKLVPNIPSPRRDGYGLDHKALSPDHFDHGQAIVDPHFLEHAMNMVFNRLLREVQV